jgi:glutaminyl-tRNA synthetase
VTYTLLSKRKLLKLVQDGHVTGWDDPRMPTLSRMRRRGYTSEAIRNFCANIGVSKTNGVTQMSLISSISCAEDLNRHALRVSAVLNPLRVVIENYPDDLVEEMEAINNPEDAERGHADGSILEDPLHRAGRFPRGSAEAVLPSGARA